MGSRELCSHNDDNSRKGHSGMGHRLWQSLLIIRELGGGVSLGAEDVHLVFLPHTIHEEFETER